MSTYFGFDAYDVDNYSDPFVFISYKSEDWERVAVYARYLHDHGLNVWYDYGLHVGTDWENYLMQVIAKPDCKAVLLFVSAKVAESSVIPLETTRARQCKKPTVAVYLEPGLNLGKLLGTAIEVYVSQRQSIDAFASSDEMVCPQVLSAAKNAMAGNQAAGNNFAEESKLWNNAQLFIRNAERSQNVGDIEKARGFLNQMTDSEPTDYRGWLGLALCECVSPVRNLDTALTLLKNAAGYYSYVVAAGADSIASDEYTRTKSYLWQRVLDVMQSEFRNCTTSADLSALTVKLAGFANFFGHTGDYIKNGYDSLTANVSNRLQELDAKAAEEAEKARREEEARQIAACCEWEPISDTEVRLKKYNGEFTEYAIPESVDGAKVTEIGEKAFEFCENLTNIIIPDSVTSIGDVAFSHCAGLTNITIPDSVTSIGSIAFYKCTGLTSITISNSVTSIGPNAFRDCTGLTSITIPNSVTSIGPNAFRDCTGLTSITIPNSVTSIRAFAFSGCTELTSITIPNRVTSIGDGAFGGCIRLTKITIPNSVTSIGDSTFLGCKSLNRITIPDSVTSISRGAFSDCTGLTSITISNSVTSIREFAFSGCTELTSITIPDSVTQIGKWAFSRCDSLTSIIIPDSITNIGDETFRDCKSLTSITIPDSVTNISESAFNDCPNLTVRCSKNSYAWKYCKKNKIRHAPLESEKTGFFSRLFG